MTHNNFNNNIKKILNCDDLENACKDWVDIFEDYKTVSNGYCLCKRKIKNGRYLLHKDANCYIIVGKKCSTKLLPHIEKYES